MTVSFSTIPFSSSLREVDSHEFARAFQIDCYQLSLWPLRLTLAAQEFHPTCSSSFCYEISFLFYRRYFQSSRQLDAAACLPYLGCAPSANPSAQLFPPLLLHVSFPLLSYALDAILYYSVLGISLKAHAHALTLPR